MASGPGGLPLPACWVVAVEDGAASWLPDEQPTITVARLATHTATPERRRNEFCASVPTPVQ